MSSILSNSGMSGDYMSEERHIEVTAEDDDQRLDRWLKKHIDELPWGLAQRLIRKTAIRVNDRKAKTSTRLKPGDIIRIPAIEDRTNRKKEKMQLTDDDRKLIESLVIYDDGNVVALNKPSGLASQGGGGIERHIDGMLELLADKKGRRPRLIHRLDRETSGVLLCARSTQAVRRLGKAFHDRKAQKTYWALVMPAPEEQSGTIEAPLEKGAGSMRDRMYISESDDAKYSVTDFIVIERAAQTAAFLAFMPQTGRTHQIRVHAADALQTPIIGDDKYGGADAKISGLKMADTLHLHARRLVVKHPLKNEVLDLVAPLSPMMAESWTTLGFDINTADETLETLLSLQEA